MTKRSIMEPRRMTREEVADLVRRARQAEEPTRPRRSPAPGERWECVRRVMHVGCVGRVTTIVDVRTVGADIVVVHRYDRDPMYPKRARSITMPRPWFLKLFAPAARHAAAGDRQ